MKVTQMPTVHAANLVANSGNTAYGFDVIATGDKSRLSRIKNYFEITFAYLPLPECLAERPKMLILVYTDRNPFDLRLLYHSSLRFNIWLVIRSTLKIHYSRSPLDDHLKEIWEWSGNFFIGPNL